MARNGKSGDGHRNGQVTDRSQLKNPSTGLWQKRDTETGKWLDINQNGKPHKGVRKEK